jgi:colicin import membrane protein
MRFPVAKYSAINKKDNLMAATTKSKAAERFAALQKRDQAVRHDIETAARLRSEKTAKLRALRLAKEAEDAETKAKEAAAKAEKPASKKVRSRAAQAQQAAKD